jgi:hypothetical protein
VFVPSRTQKHMEKKNAEAVLLRIIETVEERFRRVREFA